MKTRHIIAGLLTIAVLTILVQEVKKKEVRKRLDDVADAGYETAHDILYPLSRKRVKRSW